MKDRLTRRLMVRMHKACASRGLAPGVERLERHLSSAIDGFTDTWVFADLNAFEEWVADNYPDFDMNVGDDRELIAKLEDIKKEYRAIDAEALIANYYEGNWKRQIEDSCFESIVDEMRTEGVKVDPHSKPEDIVSAAGDECTYEYESPYN